MLMQHPSQKLRNFINAKFIIIPSDWTREDCENSRNGLTDELNGLMDDAHAFKMKHGKECPIIQADIDYTLEWLFAVNAAIETR